MGEARKKRLALAAQQGAAPIAVEPSFPDVEMGRADIGELTRRLGRTLKADQDARRREGPEKARPRVVLSLVAYPVGWNALGQIVEYEACTESKVAPFDSYLRSRGKSPESAARRMRWVVVKALVHLVDGMPKEAAMEIARKAHVMVTEVLPRRPKEMDPS